MKGSEGGRGKERGRGRGQRVQGPVSKEALSFKNNPVCTPERLFLASHADSALPLLPHRLALPRPPANTAPGGQQPEQRAVGARKASLADSR